MKNTLLVLLAICFATLASQVDLMPLTGNHTVTNAATHAPIIESYFSQLSLVHFDERGKKTSLLKTPNATQWLGSDTAMITQPKIRVWNEQSIWEMRSKKATAHLTGHDLLLDGDVVIEQQALNEVHSVQKNKNLLLNTESLTINQKTLMASSDNTVTLTHHFGEIRADGLQANFKTEQLQLRSKVSSYYEPEKP